MDITYKAELKNKIEKNVQSKRTFLDFKSKQTNIYVHFLHLYRSYQS